MIFVVVFVFIGCLVYEYDIKGHLRHRDLAFNLLLLLFISLSGFQFRIGSDISAYMYDFDQASWGDLNLSEFSLSYRQPGWILWLNTCKSLINSFVFFKFTTAIFVNCVFFYYFSNFSKFKFTCILVYYVMMSFDINFNILRQSIAIAFFLLVYIMIQKRKLYLSYLFILVSTLFHNSAVFLLIIPVLAIFNINKYHRFVVLFLWCVYAVVQIYEFNDLFLFISLLFNDDSFSELSQLYLEDSIYGYNSNNLIMLFTFILLSGYSYLYIWIKRNCNYSNWLLLMFGIYLCLFIFTSKVTIVGRVLLYFTPYAIIFLVDFIYRFSEIRIRKNSRTLFIVGMIFLLLIRPMQDFFSINPNYNERNFIQYVPYYTIFSGEVDSKRERLFSVY